MNTHHPSSPSPHATTGSAPTDSVGTGSVGTGSIELPAPFFVPTGFGRAPQAANRVRPDNPQSWWRVPCRVTDQIFISGDLDTHHRERGEQQLAEWVELGITDIIDVRDEWSDEGYVAALAPHITYHHFGTDDLDNGQPDAWFETGVKAALAALTDAGRRVMIHCHMGVNRGPSMAFAVLLALGAAPVEAAVAIRSSRPIAGIIYASDALSWWLRRSGVPELDAKTQQLELEIWCASNAVDVSWIVSRIHTAGYAS